MDVQVEYIKPRLLKLNEGWYAYRFSTREGIAISANSVVLHLGYTSEYHRSIYNPTNDLTLVYRALLLHKNNLIILGYENKLSMLKNDLSRSTMELNDECN